MGGQGYRITGQIATTKYVAGVGTVSGVNVSWLSADGVYGATLFVPDAQFPARVDELIRQQLADFEHVAQLGE